MNAKLNCNFNDRFAIGRQTDKVFFLIKINWEKRKERNEYMQSCIGVSG